MNPNQQRTLLRERLPIALLLALLSGTGAQAATIAGPPRRASATPMETAPSGSRAQAAATAANRRFERHLQALSRDLELDPAQQAQLRKLLETQRRDLLRLRADPGLSTVDKPSAVRAILDRTGDGIRAMLHPEQRRKYPAANHLSTGNKPDVEQWMSQARKGPQQAAPAAAEGQGR
jgi:hypothetical protein